MRVETIGRALVGLFLLVGAPGLFAGCGGEENTGMTLEEKMAEKKAMMEKKHGPSRGGAHAAGATPPGEPEEVVTVTIDNEKWKRFIKKHFEKVLTRKIASENVFRTRILDHIPKPVLPEEGEEPTPEELDPTALAVDEPEEEKGPLQKHPLKDYKVLMIMSGTALPKAVVEDPKGQTFVIQRETRIGDKNGHVRSITQYAIFVKEQDNEKPVPLSIRPPIIGIQTNQALGTDYDPLPEGTQPDRTPFEERLTDTPELRR